MAEPFQELSPYELDRVVPALRAWAEAQPDRSEPVLRFLDGWALTPQDLLDESPEPLYLSEDRLRALAEDPRRRPARAWIHLANLIAVSVRHGEDLDEILSDLGQELPAS